MASEVGSAVEINADLGPWQWEGGAGEWKGGGDGAGVRMGGLVPCSMS